MRHKTILFSLVVAIWLAAGQAAQAEEMESASRPDAALTLALSRRERELSESALTLAFSQGERGATDSALTLTLSRQERGPAMEERLFADVADGRLARVLAA